MGDVHVVSTSQANVGAASSKGQDYRESRAKGQEYEHYLSSRALEDLLQFRVMSVPGKKLYYDQGL
jgi:hypothetical protein